MIQARESTGPSLSDRFTFDCGEDPELRAESSGTFAEDQRVSQRLDSHQTTTLGVVLCGGNSQRMGQDKACLPFDGRTLIERAVRILEPISREVLLATGTSQRYADLHKRFVLDVVPNAGPLAGLCAALAEVAPGELLCCLACDMPFAATSHFEALIAEAHSSQLDVCMLAADGRSEPLCAVYRSSCLGPMRAALADGERRVKSFHGYAKEDGDQLSIGKVDVSRETGSDHRCTLNVNTPDDYSRALESSPEKERP